MAAHLLYPVGTFLRPTESLPEAGVVLYGHLGHPTHLAPGEPVPPDRARIQFADGRWCLDVLSGSATLNDQPVRDRAPLSSNDLIQCGPLRVRFSIIVTGADITTDKDLLPPPARPDPTQPQPPIAPQARPVADGYAHLTRTQLNAALEQAEEAQRTAAQELESLRRALNEQKTAHQCQVRVGERAQEELAAEQRVTGALRAEWAQAARDLTKERADRIALQRSVDALKKERDAAQRKQEEAERKLRAQEKRADSLESDIKALRLHNQEDAACIANLKEIVRAQQDDVSRTLRSYQDALAQIKDLERQLASSVPDPQPR